MKCLPVISQKKWSVLAVSAVMAALFIVGCTPNHRVEYVERTRVELMRMADHDLQRTLPILAKGGHLVAKFESENEKVETYNLDMVLRYQPPRKLFISGTVILTPYLEIGSNDRRYWLGLPKQENTLWWGYWKYMGKPGSGTTSAMHRRLSEALGQIDLRKLDGKYYPPALRRQQPYHVLSYLAVDDVGNMYIAKEVFLTARQRVQVEKIVYYDPDYKPEMQIDLSDYRKISDGEGQVEYVPGKIALHWPAGKIDLSLSLGRIRYSPFPDEAAEFPDVQAYEKVEQVDRDCERQ